MVGLVRDIVIPVKGDPVLTIVCEILSAPSQDHPQQEEEVENPHITRLWKVRRAQEFQCLFRNSRKGLSKPSPQGITGC